MGEVVMVNKEDCNEIAVIFSNVESELNGYTLYYFVPRRVVQGYLNKDENIFIDEDDNGYYHIVTLDVVSTFGKRISLSELLKKYPNVGLSEAKRLYFNEVKEKLYFCNPVGETLLDCYKEIDKSGDNLRNIKDKDIEYFIDLYSEATDFYADALLSEDGNLLESDLSTNLNNKNNREAINVLVGLDKNAKKGTKTKDFKLNIKKLYEELSKNVIGQEEAHKKILATIWKNFSNNNGKAENIFVNGPTGVGKTETFQVIARNIGVPIVVEDCNEFTMAGYKGRDVEEILDDLYRESGKDINMAQKGIVILDEIDKIASSSSSSEINVSTEGVQNAILKMLENYKYRIDGKVLETKGITFVALGAFSDIEKQEAPVLGFNSTQIKKEYQNITLDDLNKYGMKQEILGRFSTLIPMKALTREDMKKILLESDLSPLLNLKNYYKGIGIELVFDDAVIDAIVDRAMKYNTGARGLKTALTDVTYEADMELAFNDENTFKKLYISNETIDNPKKYVLKR